MCQQMAVCDEWVRRRIADMGRLDKIAGLIHPNGTLQWSTHGVYTFRVLDNKYTIVHCDGTEAAWPEGGANLSKCLLTDNHSDILGVVRIGTRRRPS